MFYAGLDLAAKPTNPSGLAILQGSRNKPKLTKLSNAFTDEQIIEAVKGVDYLAIDAPLIKGSTPNSLRPAEKYLIGLGLRVMAPSFLRDLVKRAQQIKSLLPKKVKVIEVHPRSSALMLGLNIRKPVFNKPQLKKLIDIKNMACANKHQFDGLISSYTAFLYHQNLIRLAGEDGSFIALPASRKIKLAVFDMDGTLTKPTSSWEHIHRKLGTWENGGLTYLKQFLASKISYSEFARLDTSEWKGMPLEKIKMIASQVEYMPGIEKLMHFLSQNNIKTAIISGGLSVIADKIASDFNIKRVFINHLGVRNGILTGSVKINVTFNGKLPIYKELLRELKLKPYQVMTVGDTNGDVPLFKNSGLAVAINPLHDGVSEVADSEIKSLDEIIPILS